MKTFHPPTAALTLAISIAPKPEDINGQSHSVCGGHIDSARDLAINSA